MNGFLGGDIARMGALQKQLKTRANELRSISSRLQSRGKDVYWQGRDADQFKHHDLNTMKACLERAASRLDDGAHKLQKNIAEQEEAAST